MLILFAPGPPREEYFSELAEIRSAGRTLTDEDWIEVCARHDQSLTPPGVARHGVSAGSAVRGAGAVRSLVRYHIAAGCGDGGQAGWLSS